MIARTLLALAAALSLGACATVPPQPAAPLPAAPEGSSGWLKPGESANLGPVVTPLSVEEDSRCPQDVQCVWAGRVVVKTRIMLRGGAEVRTVAMELGKPVGIADGTMALVAVAPDKTAEAAIAPADYRFAYRFDGGL